MSKTDVHRPFTVQMEDPYNRHRVRWFTRHATQIPDVLPLYNTCGCWMCTGHYERFLSRRHQRRRTKQLLRAERWDEVTTAEPGRYWYSMRPNTWRGAMIQREAETGKLAILPVHRRIN